MSTSLPALTTTTVPSPSSRPLDEHATQELDAAVKGFEKLMVQRLLTSARRSHVGDEPSNARANHDAMFDEAIAGVIAERGDLGLADALRTSLGEGGSLQVAQRSSAKTGLGTPAQGSPGLDAQALATLRGMLDGASMPPPSASAEQGLSSEASHRAIATLSAPERLRTAATTGDDALARRAFIDRLRPHAERSAERLGTTADTVLAIAAHESGWGRHPIVASDGRDSHNLFGIKAHGREGPSVDRATTEFVGGVARRVVAEFRAYPDPGASVDDFASFLIENPRYGDALRVAADPARFFDALQAAGYATDPDYADKARAVLRQIERVSEEPST